MNSQLVHETELSPPGGIRKRNDASGRATAELISELQK